MAAPLLTQYGLRAITYAIPARITENGEGDSPFVTWSELAALHASGVIDVQSHTDSHSRIFVSARRRGLRPAGLRSDTPLLNRPQLVRAAGARVRDAGRPRRAALRHAVADVRRPPRAGAARRPHERASTSSRAKAARRSSRGPTGATARRLVVAAAPPRVRERGRTVARDRRRARAQPIDPERAAEDQTVAHICLPWGISGARTEAMLEADRLSIGVRQPSARPACGPRRRRSVLAEAAAEPLHHAPPWTRPAVPGFHDGPVSRGRRRRHRLLQQSRDTRRDAGVAGCGRLPRGRVLVVDGGSTDGTAEWLRAAHPDVRVRAPRKERRAQSGTQHRHPRDAAAVRVSHGC